MAQPSALLLRQLRLASSATASAKHVKELRQRTGLSIMLCRKALLESGDNVEAAMTWIDENEEARAAKAAFKLADRAVSQGRMALAHNAPTLAAMVEVSCETDFVARNDAFGHLADEIAKACLGLASSSGPSAASEVSVSKEALSAAAFADGKSVKEHIASAMGSLGENITLARGTALFNPKGAVDGYVHNMGSHAALVSLNINGPASSEATEKTMRLCQRLAQHIVALDPAELSTNAAEAYEEMHKQPFVLDSSRTIRDLLAESSEEIGASLSIKEWIRWQRGQANSA